MTAKTVTILITSFLIIGSFAFIASANQTNDSDKYTFQNYGGEVYTPEPMVFGANLNEDFIQESGSARKHMWLQFYETPNEEQLELLEDYGVQRVAVAARRTLICSMPADMTAADLPAENGLRWMGEIPVENKYDYNHELNIPGWARTENGDVKLAIDFHEDVTSQDSTSIVKKYCDNFSAPSNFRPWYYETITNETNITLIASEDAVQSVGYYGAEEEPCSSDFVDYEVIDEEYETDSVDEQENGNVAGLDNESITNEKTTPGFSAFITGLVFILSFCMLVKK